MFSFRLTRSQRRRRIGVQPISSSVAGALIESQEDRNDQVNDDASVFSGTPVDSLLCEARLNDRASRSG